MHSTTAAQRAARPAGDTLVLPHQPWQGKLDWRALLGWLRDDKLIESRQRATRSM